MGGPLVTYALFTFNQARYIEAAVASALAQTYTPLHIVLSDDGSSDDTFERMQRMVAAYRGPHEVELNRNPRNLGIAGHVNRVMQLVRGELVVAAAGDDISVPHRTEVVIARWLASNKRAMSLHSTVALMDPDGKDLGLLPLEAPERLNDRRRVARDGLGMRGASHAWSPRVFEVFGPLLPEVVHEDVTIPFRSMLLGTIEYLQEPLVRWRLGVSSWGSAQDHSFDLAEMRRRGAFNQQLAYVDAVQAFADATRHGDPDILALVRERLAEQRALVRIARGDTIGLGELAAAILDGADPARLVKYLVKFRDTPIYRAMLWLKARRDAAARRPA